MSVATGLRLSAPGGYTAFCAMLLLAGHAALAQSPEPQGPSPQPAAPQAQPVAPQMQPPAVQTPPPQTQPVPDAAPKREGFFDAVGRWWNKSARDFKAKVDESNAKWRSAVEESNAKWRSSVEENNARWRDLNRKTEQAAKEAAAAQKEAADEFVRKQKEAADALKNLSNLRMVEGRQVCEMATNGSPDCQAAAESICKGKGFATGKSADVTTSRKCSARALLQRDESECRTETVVIKAACQ